tara:strand:- start:1848 stop:2198 length:351 start_codon:yes stop_codon:yes gene_type:complete
MKFRLKNLGRIYKQLIMFFVDLVILFFALWLAFILRIGDPFPFEYIYCSWWIFFAIPILIITLFFRLGLYRAILQYIDIKIMTTIFKATTLSCLAIGFFMIFFRESSLPRSVLPIF